MLKHIDKLGAGGFVEMATTTTGFLSVFARGGAPRASMAKASLGKQQDVDEPL